MLDPDAYFPLIESVKAERVRKPESPPIALEHLKGGCLLYRLPFRNDSENEEAGVCASKDYEQ